MSMHTPGPWEMDEEGQVFSRGALVATVNVRQYAGSDVWDWDTAGADGQLITAAPDMLAALQNALEFIEGYEDVRDSSDGQPLPNEAMTLAGELRRVIAKATGAGS